MTELTIAAPRAQLPLYLAVPDGQGPWPGVVVIHESYGLTGDIRAWTARFAQAGYLAFAPDLYTGKPWVRCVRSAIQQVRSGSGPQSSSTPSTSRPRITTCSMSSTVSWCAARAVNSRDVTPGRSRPVSVIRMVSCAFIAGVTLPGLTRGQRTGVRPLASRAAYASCRGAPDQEPII